MNPVAAIFDSMVLYRYSIVLALAGVTGLCFFMACCSYTQIPDRRAAAAALLAVALSLPLSRLVYWYGRPDAYPSLFLALTTPSAEAFALVGVFAACLLSALLLGGHGGRKKMLDCMSTAGCWAIFLGRLGFFFTAADRGQIMTQVTGLPWVYPVVNASGLPEYRFATFLFQAVAAAVLAVFLAVQFFRRKQPGEVTLFFILIYCASQFILDSTRYDSLYLQSNGFISLIQMLSAAALVVTLAILCIRTIKNRGQHLWMLPLCASLVFLLSTAGYMEYYVQRHGREASLAYSIMGACLICIVALGMLLNKLSQKD